MYPDLPSGAEWMIKGVEKTPSLKFQTAPLEKKLVTNNLVQSFLLGTEGVGARSLMITGHRKMLPWHPTML